MPAPSHLPPYPDPPPPAVAEIPFVAVHRENGRRIASSVSIRPPVRMAEQPFDYMCRVDLSGIETSARRVFGVTAFQALELGLKLSRMQLSGHLRRWRFESDGGQSLDFIAADEP